MLCVKSHHSDVLQGPIRELCTPCMLPSWRCAATYRPIRCVHRLCAAMIGPRDYTVEVATPRITLHAEFGCVLQWPTRELCPLCMLPSLGAQQDIIWNEDEVYRFLVHFYQGSSPQAGLDVTGAAAGYQDGGYAGR